MLNLNLNLSLTQTEIFCKLKQTLTSGVPFQKLNRVIKNLIFILFEHRYYVCYIRIGFESRLNLINLGRSLQ